MSRRCGHDPVRVVAQQPLFASLTEAECQALVQRSLCLPLGEVQVLYRTNPEVAHAVVRELGARVRTLAALVDRLTLQDVPTRVAAAVLHYAEESGGATFRLPCTQEELAAELGTTRESVARALHDLRAAGVIRQRGARVELVKVAELCRRTGRASRSPAAQEEPWSTQTYGSRRSAASRVTTHVS